MLGLGLFSSRLAPVQINYLGYPGTLGADFIDYIVADQNLIPESFQAFISEKPIYLPHTIGQLIIQHYFSKGSNQRRYGTAQ